MILPIFKKYKKLLISIMLVSAMGCGFMTGLSASYTSLDVSLSNYLDEYCCPDAVITTDVTSRDVIDKLKIISSVSEINARMCGDTYLKSIRARYLSVRIFSYSPDDKQKFYFWERRDSEGKDEIYLEYNFANDNHIKAGDTVKVKADNEYNEYFVSGIVSCPETISVQPTDDSWGVNTDFGYAYVSAKLISDEYEKKYGLTPNIPDSSIRFENIIVGALLYTVLNNGLTMMGMTTQAMQLIQGVVFLIFVAVFADRESLQVIK